MTTTAQPLIAQGANQVEHLLRLRDAQRGGRLVEQHHARIAQDRPGDGDGLPLSAGELRDQ